MMHFRAFFILLSVFIFINIAHADIKLFLQQRVITEKQNPELGDIALIEGNYPDIQKIKSIQIENSIYSDGYIDRKEIYSLIKRYTSDNVFIYGNAVRIAGKEENTAVNETCEFSLKKGDRVEIVIRKKGISLIMRGIAVTESSAGGEVSVKIENRMGAQSRLLTGKIISRDIVEVNL